GPRRLDAHRVNAHVGPASLGHLADRRDHVYLGEVQCLDLGVVAGELEAIGNVVYADHAPGTEQPSRPLGEQSDGTTTEHHDRLPYLDLAHFRGLVARGQ